MTKANHFKGKSVPEHLKEARLKGASIERESHGLEAPGHIAAFFDSLKDVGVLFLLLFAFLSQLTLSPSKLAILFGALTIGVAIWKWGRSSLMGWARLERLHRLIEEERYEVMHHREQEKQELQEMYQAKGFSGKLLEEVVDVLMADENRLLQVMLEEELGLTLQSHQHPLVQGLGAACGTLVSGLLSLGLFLLYPAGGILIASGLLAALSGAASAKRDGNRLLGAAIWNLSVCYMAGFITYFSTHFLLRFTLH